MKKTIQSLVVLPPDSVENKYKVPVKQWRKWNDKGKKMFNFLYGTAKDNEKIIFGRDIFKIKDGDCVKAIDKSLNAGMWNMAWEAADYVTDMTKK